MKGNGYIKLYRSVLDWEWYTDANTFRVFFHLILKANYVDKMWKGGMIKRGQVLTSRSHLSKELCISEQQIRTALNRLKSTNEITIESTSEYSVITVCNWELYQSKENESTSDLTNNLTNEQPAINQPSTKTKEYKERKKERNNIYIQESLAKQPAFITIQGLSMTEKEYNTLVSKFGKNNVEDVMEAARNYKPFKQKYNNLYLTLNQWLKKREANNPMPRESKVSVR